MKIPFGKHILSAILKGFGLGTIFYLIAVAINGVMGIWGIAAEILFFIIGFSIPIAIAISPEDEEEE